MQLRSDRIAQMALVAGLVLVVLRGEAHAYLDAGTGSLILQGLVGGAMAAAFFLRQRWADIRRRISGKPAPPTDAPES